MIAPIRRAPKYPQSCPAPVPAVLVSTSAGLRLAWMRKMMMRPVAPMSSDATPMLLIRERTVTPMTLIVVVSATMISPRMTAFTAKSVLK